MCPPARGERAVSPGPGGAEDGRADGGRGPGHHPGAHLTGGRCLEINDFHHGVSRCFHALGCSSVSWSKGEKGNSVLACSFSRIPWGLCSCVASGGVLRGRDAGRVGLQLPVPAPAGPAPHAAEEQHPTHRWGARARCGQTRFQAIFTRICYFFTSETNEECSNGLADEEGPELSSPMYALMAVVFGVFKAIHFFRKVRHTFQPTESNICIHGEYSKSSNLDWVK